MKKFLISFLSFLITFLILIAIDSDIKFSIDSVQDASFPLSFTLKKQSTVLSSISIDRNISSTPNKANQQNSTPFQQCANSYQFFTTVGFFVITTLMLIFILYTLIRKSGSGNSNTFQQMLQLQKENEKNTKTSFEDLFKDKEENLKNYINTQFSDTSQKIETLSKYYQDNTLVLMKSISENLQQIASIKKYCPQTSKGIEKQLSDLSQQIQRLSVVICRLSPTKEERESTTDQNQDVA